MQVLENSVSDKVTGEVEKVTATVETRVHDAILFAMDNWVTPQLELAMRSVGVFLNLNPKSVVLYQDQADFAGHTNSLQMAALRVYNSNTNMDRIDEIYGNGSFEACDLAVSGRNLDRETHIRHINPNKVNFFFEKSDDAGQSNDSVTSCSFKNCMVG